MIYQECLPKVIMGKPFRCKIGRHEWEDESHPRLRTCKFCGTVSSGMANVPLRCKLGSHSWEIRGKAKWCKFCNRNYTSWSRDRWKP